MKTIELNKYKGVIYLLTQKPEPSIIVGHWLCVKLTADDMADILGCSKNSIGTYIGRMRKEGYDVRINKEGEYWVEPAEDYCPDFKIEIGEEPHAGHMIKTTHNGHQWSSITLGTLQELRDVHAALGAYIQEQIDEA